MREQTEVTPLHKKRASNLTTLQAHMTQSELERVEAFAMGVMTMGRISKPPEPSTDEPTNDDPAEKTA